MVNWRQSSISKQIWNTSEKTTKKGWGHFSLVDDYSWFTIENIDVNSPSSTLYGVEVWAEHCVERKGVLEDIRVSTTAKGAKSSTVQEG